ncbi:MAG: type VI secretion system ATPase TssH [Thalassobaculales bacterium]
MVAVDLKALFGRLNQTCNRTLEAAAGLTMSRTHYNVEVEHWLLKLLEMPDSDLTQILRHYEIDAGRVTADLTRTLDRFKTGNGRGPALSPNVVALAREAWVLASLQFGAAKVRSGHLVLALLGDDGLSGVAREASSHLARIPAEALKKDLDSICSGTAEAAQTAPLATAATPAAGAAPGQPAAPGGPSRTPSLDQFTIDLTARAKAGRIDPVLGRDAEIRQVIDILTRRRQNNPILTGEPGVGKTAVAEGFALRIAAGDVPDALKGVTLRTLDLGLLQAGAGVKGEFENRLKNVIEEVKASPSPIILFIDEAHTLIGAGGQAGQGDAANLLKPALARGELRTVAATTWAEYKKYFERDAALARRFQVVKVEEPTEAVAIQMIQGLVHTLEKHHKVPILQEATVEAVRLSHRYIPSRQLPDKAVSLIDTACARVAMSQSAIPAAVEDCRRRIELTATEIGILEREAHTGARNEAELEAARKRKADAEAELEALEGRWKREQALVTEIRGLRDRLEAARKPPEGGAAAPTPEEQQGWRDQMAALEGELKTLQGESPLMQVCVDGQAIAEVVAAWTGIPVGRMRSDEIRTIMNLREAMEARIIGQSHALEVVAETMRTSRAGLTDPRKPIGVFMFVGTSGVGKTETALTLADLIYGGEQNLTVINMSEFKEEHKVSMLLGSPPGYVGYGEGGVLTEAVRRKPYSVVLLDEMEKAHPGVQDVFYQVFDKGMLKDGEGRDIDFKNCVIIMTSNAGTDTIHRLCADPETMPDAAGLAEALRPDLLKLFKPAFLGRVTMVPYFPLSEENVRKIVVLQLNRIRKRVAESHKATFRYPDELVANIAARCTEVESGARNIEHILSRVLLPEMSARILERMAEGLPIRDIEVSLDAEGQFSYALN